MKHIFLVMFFLWNFNLLWGQTPVYLLPGQGADYRLFNHIDLGEDYTLKYIHYTIPEKGMSMLEYAQSLSTQIDTSQAFILIGTSLGGMLSVEMSEFLAPEKVIIISSAKSRNELPGQYRFQTTIPIYKLIPGSVSKGGALLLQPMVEPDRNQEKDTFVAMLKAKDPDFMKRSIAMIMEWDREAPPEGIVHIHGDMDSTIPIRNIDYDYLIPGGSHMMTLTRGAEISALIVEILTNCSQ